jgi:hypothetical protein
MRYLALLLIFTLSYAADTKPLPLETQAELAKSDKAMTILKADYLKRANQEVQRLTYALQDQMKKLTQAGDLEGALLLRDKIAEVGKGDMVSVTNTTMADLFAKPIEQMVVGKWLWKRPVGDVIIVYNADKTAELIGGNASKGKWSIEDGKFTLVWDRWGKEVVTYNDKTDTITNASKTWTATRIKP